MYVVARKSVNRSFFFTKFLKNILKMSSLIPDKFSELGFSILRNFWGTEKENYFQEISKNFSEIFPQEILEYFSEIFFGGNNLVSRVTCELFKNFPRNS